MLHNSVERLFSPPNLLPLTSCKGVSETYNFTLDLHGSSGLGGGGKVVRSVRTMQTCMVPVRQVPAQPKFVAPGLKVTFR